MLEEDKYPTRPPILSVPFTFPVAEEFKMLEENEFPTRPPI